MTVEEFSESLSHLLSPDKYSRNPANEGRRIEPHPEGWRILNYQAYRQKRDDETRRKQTREAVARYRERIKKNDPAGEEEGKAIPVSQEVSQEVSQSKPGKAQAEAEAEAEKYKGSFLENLSRVERDEDVDNSGKKDLVGKGKKGKDPTNGQGTATAEQKQELAGLCALVSRRFGDFNPWSWLARNRSLNPSTHIHVMRQMATAKEIVSPWPYANKIASIENGNFNEAESAAAGEKHKAEIGQVGKVLKDLLTG
jgi:hypothetical protein